MQENTEEKKAGRILIVDDEKDITNVLSDVLRGKGYATQTAPNGSEGVKLYKEHPYDVVITDLKMPVMGGLDMLSALRKIDKNSIIIIMTGYATVETAINALKSGAYDYILKPFKVGELLTVVERAFEKIRLSSENLQLREQITLLKLSESVSSSLSLDEVLSILVDAAQKEVDADGLEILFRPPGTKEFSRRLATGNISEIDKVFADLSTLERELGGGSTQWRGKALDSLIDEAAKPVVRSAMSVPFKRGGEILGVLNAYSSSKHREFLPREEKALIVLGDRAASSVENALLYADLESSFRETIQGLAMAVEAKDVYTHGHSEAVTNLCVAVATEMNCSSVFIDTLRQAGLLHDIGKIGISSNILNKAGKLSPEEYEIIKNHSQMGRRILEKISFLKDVVPIVYHHHERYDGKGYPDGLSGEDIPLGARVIQVADTYDAMNSDRPYRKGLGHEMAVMELKRCSGTQFDPQCVDAFLRMVERNGMP